MKAEAQLARRPLIHVVVSVDEAGHGEAVGLVDHLVGGRRRTRSDLGDHPVAREHPAVIDLLAAREQQPRLEEKGQRVRSCGRTGTRLMSRPVAARIAATIAGPDEIVGGSPTPFSPYGERGSPSSSTSICTGGMSRMVG